MEKDHNILNTIDRQLSAIEKLVEKDLERQEVIDDYYVCETYRALLDIVSLDTYLSETKIENTSTLKSINKRCFKLINLWNDVLWRLPENKLKKKFWYQNQEMEHPIERYFDFHALYIGDKIKPFHVRKEMFFKLYKYNQYSLRGIIDKCIDVLDFICAAYPETDPELKAIEEPGQNMEEEEKKKDEVANKHTNIFKNNAFEVWDCMFKEFNIKESSRTDIRFMFDTMQTDSLIHETVTQTNILDWINKTYQLAIDKPPFKDFKTDHKRNSIYSTAKQLYKTQGT